MKLGRRAAEFRAGETRGADGAGVKLGVAECPASEIRGAEVAKVNLCVAEVDS